MKAEGMSSVNRKPVTKEAGRVCADEGCTTVLSVYNKTDWCGVHGRTRARKPTYSEDSSTSRTVHSPYDKDTRMRARRSQE